jgi:hypothetical protein
MSGSGQKFYEEGDAEEILKLAMSRSPAAGAISREKLLQTAEELGITPEALADAELKYERQKNEQQEFNEFIAQQRRGFFGHLTSYVIVNAFLVTINLITDPGDIWFHWPLLGWGIGIAFHAVGTFAKGSEMQREAFRDWRRRRTLVRLLDEGNLSRDELHRVIEDYVKATREDQRQPTRFDAIEQLAARSGVATSDARDIVELYASQHPDEFK